MIMHYNIYIIKKNTTKKYKMFPFIFTCFYLCAEDTEEKKKVHALLNRYIWIYTEALWILLYELKRFGAFTFLSHARGW